MICNTVKLGADGHPNRRAVPARHPVDQGLADKLLADKYLADQLHRGAFEAACATAGQPLTLRRHAGYDHGYCFIAGVVDEHLRHHADQLKR